jgi:16S rRNA (adenine1518-N6/adenine1519-N6)-dimethyltransferase
MKEFSLRSVIDRHNLQPQKKLGQNFILDQNITDKIARSAGVIEGQTILEIGPGPGGLTRSILKQNPKHLYAIEKDPRCIAAIQEIGDPRLSIIEADALKFDITTLPSNIKIIANLPYNIGTELLMRWLDNISHLQDLTIMLQKEVADRITATPDNKEYGRLSVFCQWLCDIHIAFDLPPEVFFPPPKVTSSVIHLKPLVTPRYPADAKTLQHVVKTAFNQRRKMLRGSLKSLSPDIEGLLRSADIRPDARPEDITIEAFCRLACLVHSL